MAGCGSTEVPKKEEPAAFSELVLNRKVFEKINEYRASNNLTILSWDKGIYEGAKHHTDYEYLLNKEEIESASNQKDIMVKARSGHDETYVVPGIPGENFELRSNKYNFIGECVIMYSGHIEYSEEVIADWIVKAWKDSPSHNEILIDPRYSYGAIASKAFVMVKIPLYEKNAYNYYGLEYPKDIIYFSSTFNCR